MRKAFILLLSLVLIFSLAACGKKTENTPSDSSTTSTQGSSTDTPSNSEKSGDGIKVGDTYTFGGKDWIVIDVVKDEKALIISKAIIEIKAFNVESGDHTWENCDLRKYLNGDYFNNTFSDVERSKILETDVKAVKNTEYPNVLIGNDTKDNVFLLSIQEAAQYFADDNARIAKYTSDDGTTLPNEWYLRTVGLNNESTSFINAEGKLNLAGATNDAEYGVRPAIWIDIKPETADSSTN